MGGGGPFWRVIKNEVENSFADMLRMQEMALCTAQVFQKLTGKDALGS